jgi:hypothetical protein
MKITKRNTNSLEKSSKDHAQLGIKPAVYIGEYRDFRDFKMKPATEGFIERLGRALIQWAEVEPQAYKLNQFLRLQGLAAEQFYDWVLKYPELKAAHGYAMKCIGDRRELGALEKRISENMVLKTLYIYDPTHAQARQDEIDAKKEIAMVNNEAHTRPTQIILGELPGMKEYKELQQKEDVVE